MTQVHKPGQWKEYYGVLPPAQGTTVTTNEKKSLRETQVGGDHYTKMPIQVWDFVIANDLDYFQGSILKYICRWRDKDWLQDLYKARNFLDKYIDTMEKKYGHIHGPRPDGQEDVKTQK